VKLKIGLFGGTFDPVHNGHIEIVQAYLNSGFVDSIWVLPSAFPPQKSIPSASFENRVQMLNIAFEHFRNVRIDSVESTLPIPNYTIQTLQHLHKSSIGIDFFWCIGSDQLVNFTTWHRYDEILDSCSLLVVKRPGSLFQDVPKSILDKCHFIEHSPIDISSTKVRNDLRMLHFSNQIPEKVMMYINNHHLYH
jgi:nicotinate-nucleotide adenylyltransferase